ncbi:hypothetical protein SteCoe_16321 [Stentor coeruleus]|uniref:N-acetyltransferase domain-containing protein n=1 Tax=Stentor coeruleus TaxID=5963 RepID=A0A1R2C1D0_9CILI|nr:hypothetical protein SteCoe_16321 [Stentor coeruleus]
MEAKKWEDIKEFVEKNPDQMERFIAGATYTNSNGITFSKIPSDKEDEAFSMLTNVVVNNEPLAVKLQMSEQGFKKNVCQNLLKMSNYQDLSIGAFDGDKVVGVFMSVDWSNQKRSMPETKEDVDFWRNKMNPLFSFILMNNASNVKKSKILCHGITSGVLDEYTNKGIARNALALRLALAKSLGFSDYIIEAGYGASNAFKVYKHYMEFGSEMPFADFVFENRKPFGDSEGGYVVFCRSLV